MSDYHSSYAEGKPPVVPCPVCGAPPDLRTWQKLNYEQYARILSPAHSMLGSPIVPLVCTSCGYVQLFTNPLDFRQ
jgi:hypothetical protein